jgi:hypothetical protein
MRRMLAILLILVIPGCATIFSGSSQRVSIRATPEDTTIIVLGGPTGAAIAKVAKVAHLQRRVLGLLAGTLRPEDEQLILEVGLERFITGLILDVKTGQVPPDTTAQLGELYRRIPRPIKDKLVSTFGLEAFGVGRVDEKLDRGENYAVNGWRTGSVVKIRSIDGSFNWATLWNILNLGLGVPVDLYTGAWLKLSPASLDLALQPLPAAAP